MNDHGGIGKVYLVGAGPGDPGLLTRKGADVLSRADVVVYDHLSSSRLLDLAPATASRIFAGKSRGKCPIPQEEINRTLVHHARSGALVVRLKGGDPYIFGRGAEEAEHLRAAGIPFEVVPGVTAATGVTAYAGLPLTHRDESSAVAFVTGHADPFEEPGRLDWGALARFPGTLVFYMGFRHHEAICRRLHDEGMSGEMPAALVQSGTVAAQRACVGTISNLHHRVISAGLGSPSLLVVGRIVSRRSSLAWFEELPLFGQRVLITRPAAESARAAADLEAMGAEAIIAPTVEILPVSDAGPLDSALDRLGSYDWIVFTSANGVRHFLDRMWSRGLDARAISRARLAAIGPATADELVAHRLRADLVPPSYRSEDLAEALIPRATGGRVLLARADRGRTVLRDRLEDVATVEQVPVYRNADAAALPEAAAERLEQGTIDWITLTSSAITERLHALMPARARERVDRGEIRLASLSPVTTAAAERLGWAVAVEASEYTWLGLLNALADRVASEKQG